MISFHSSKEFFTTSASEKAALIFVRTHQRVRKEKLNVSLFLQRICIFTEYGNSLGESENAIDIAYFLLHTFCTSAREMDVSSL